jgi:hypothetical protein
MKMFIEHTFDVTGLLVLCHDFSQDFNGLRLF